MTSIAEAFETYRTAVVPAGVSDVQLQETERAFYAGAYLLLTTLHAEIGDDDVSEEAGVQQLEALKAECEAYAARVDAPPAPLDIHHTAPTADQIRPVLEDLARLVRANVPDGMGFTLLLFDFGAGGNLFYISNAQRADVISTMREFLNRQTS